MPRLRVLLVAVVTVSCTGRDEGPNWVRVVRDASYDVAIDTSRVRHYQNAGPTNPLFSVWYRTDHATPRLHKEEQFNREVVNSLVDCEKQEFKVLAVIMSMKGSRPISVQRTEERDVAWQAWRPIAPGTSDEIAAEAACHFAKRLAPTAFSRPSPPRHPPEGRP